MDSMELLGDMGHMESLSFLFGDSVSVGARFAPNVPYAQKLFWTHPMVLLGDYARVEARFGPFGVITNLDAR